MKKLLLGLFLLSSTTYGAAIGFGTYSPLLGSYQEELDGSTEGVFSINPYVAIHEQFRIFGSRHLFAPEIGYVLPSTSHDLDDGSKRSMIFVLWNFSWELFPSIVLKYGLGTFWTRISGGGGVVRTPNGTEFRDAFLPDESQTSYNSTINLGVEAYLTPQWTGKLELHTWQPFNSDARRFSVAIGANYYFGGFSSGGGL